jgi:hypothetical protein
VTSPFDVDPVGRDEGEVVARSREGHPVRGFVLGDGPTRVSLIGGCHADEPVGPLMLRHLAAWLRETGSKDHRWWIVPHANPDGEERNRAWYSDDDEFYDPVAYFRHRIRELPGDDLEFGFPRGEGDEGARPEARGIAAWWREARGPFALHASLHGMATAGGPWFLIDRDWIDRTATLRRACARETERLGYRLHDVERRGEKGFTRIERGFCTRPDSRAMTAHFRVIGDEETAALFRPSSMEYVRSLGGDTLTLVSEMPLFVTPGVGEAPGPPDTAAEEWKARIGSWAMRGDVTRSEMEAAGLRPMPVRDQMALQWFFVREALAAIR